MLLAAPTTEKLVLPLILEAAGEFSFQSKFTDFHEQEKENSSTPHSFFNVKQELIHSFQPKQTQYSN
jgi:hypothetical protein